MIYVLSGGQTGATLTVTSSGAGTITVSNTTLGKSYSKSVTAGGSAVFKGLQTGTWTVKLTDGSKTSTKTIAITSDYTTNIAYFSATISITYPAKSTCVVKNSGGTTVASNSNTGSSTKTWTATVNATGTYTITATATDGSGNTKSTTVNITTNGQSESVKLSYSLHLFELGVGLANGYSMNAWNGGTFDENGLVFSSTNIRANIRPAIDLSEYKSMSVTYTYKMNSTGNGPGRIGFQTSDNYMSYNAYDNNFPASVKLTANVTDKQVSLDISSLSGDYYFAIHTFDSISFKITDIELFP